MWFIFATLVRQACNQAFVALIMPFVYNFFQYHEKFIKKAVANLSLIQSLNYHKLEELKNNTL